jgi:hypothetical protein
MYRDRVPSRVALRFLCPVCEQEFHHVLDFTDSDERVVGCMPCQSRFRVAADGTVRPANRPIPPFTAHTLSLVD